MRLCHIVPSLEPQHGGPSRSVHALCAALARNGDTVDLLTTQPTPSRAESAAQIDRLNVRTFARQWPQRLCVSRPLAQALAGSDADVFHHHSLWLRTLHYAHERTKRGGVLVISPRGMMSRWAMQHRGWRKRFARAFVHPGALDAADGWHATSAEEQAEIHDLGFRQPICVAPNGIEAPDAAEVERAAAYWREACPTSRSRPVALFYSRFHPKKRVLELIDVWLAHGPRDWLLLLVGIPQDYTPEMLEAYATRMSGTGRVAAFSGVDAPPPYSVASLFLLPSHNENFGLVVAEAMAHGVPVLVTDTTPWTAVREEQRGWCVPWDQYAEALRNATAEPREQLRERGARARAWVLREFSWEKSARLLAGFYRTLGDKKP